MRELFYISVRFGSADEPASTGDMAYPLVSTIYANYDTARRMCNRLATENRFNIYSVEPTRLYEE